jgi:hypothetical protein
MNGQIRAVALQRPARSMPGKESIRMKRVVESLPDAKEMAARGLKKGDFRVDAVTYRHFVDRYRVDFGVFSRQFTGGLPAGETKPAPPPAGPRPAGEACLAAFEANLPPYHYHQGGFYSYRIDRAAGADRPIILEGFEREEITGWAGIPSGAYHRGILLEILSLFGSWLSGARGKAPRG